MITLDTSGLLAYMNLEDRNHDACAVIMEADPGPYVVPAAILAELTFLLEQRHHPDVEQAFLEDLEAGRYTPEWSPLDLKRIRELIVCYADLPLGFADAAVVACAERYGGRVLTTDWRHFPVVARGEKTITALP